MDNSGRHDVVGSDFNDEFSHSWMHIALLTHFCEDFILNIDLKHERRFVDYWCIISVRFNT